MEILVFVFANLNVCSIDVPFQPSGLQLDKVKENGCDTKRLTFYFSWKCSGHVLAMSSGWRQPCNLSDRMR